MANPGTRHSLIVRLKDHDSEAAWAEFVSAYESFLSRLVERFGVPERHQADVVQQILLAVARSVEGWSSDGRPGSFRRWLATVSRNIVIRFMTSERRQAGGRGGTDVLNLLHRVAAEPGEEQIRQYEHELIVWAAEEVRDEFVASSWKAFWGTTIGERSVHEMAAELNLTPGSIYMSRSRILARIRRKVEEVLQ